MELGSGQRRAARHGVPWPDALNARDGLLALLAAGNQEDESYATLLAGLGLIGSIVARRHNQLS